MYWCLCQHGLTLPNTYSSFCFKWKHHFIHTKQTYMRNCTFEINAFVHSIFCQNYLLVCTFVFLELPDFESLSTELILLHNPDRGNLFSAARTVEHCYARGQRLDSLLRLMEYYKTDGADALWSLDADWSIVMVYLHTAVTFSLKCYLLQCWAVLYNRKRTFNGFSSLWN